jgi:D-alanyl-D-alanine carboxypeptidase
MTRRIIVLLSLSVTVVLSILIGGGIMNKKDSAEYVLKKLTYKQQTPSVQYLIFNSERVIYSWSNGLADIAKNRAANSKTTYHTYSVTKTFTALAILQLASDGKLDIDDPVYRYLPEFSYGRQITIRNLLSHSSGIPNPIPLNWIHLAEDHRNFNKHDFFEQVTGDNSKVKYGPNEKFAYSNIGYMILGQLIEKVSGQPYEAYVEEHILKKLSPNDLAFQIPDPAAHATGYHKRWSIGNAVLGFFIDKTEFMDQPVDGWKPFKPIYVNDPAYGGLIGTPAGFMAFIRKLLNEDSDLIPNHYKEILFTENILAGGKSSGMSLSWFMGELNGVRYYTHAGGGGGYYVEIRIYPEASIGSVIMFNRSGMKDERFLDKTDRFFIRPHAKASRN